MKDFLRESSWSVEAVRFLLFSLVLLVSTLRFMVAYVRPGHKTKITRRLVEVFLLRRRCILRPASIEHNKMGLLYHVFRIQWTQLYLLEVVQLVTVRAFAQGWLLCPLW